MYNAAPGTEEIKTVTQKQTDGVNNVTGPVVIPLLQSVITGVLAGLVVMVILLWAKAPWWFPASILAMVGVMFISWQAYRNRWQMVIESFLGVDLNGDGYIGAPQAAPLALDPSPIRVELVQDAGQHTSLIDLPASPEQLQALVTGILRGKSFTLNAWLGTFTRPEFETLRDVLIMRGLARWKNENVHHQGADLTPAGKAVFKRLAEEYHPSLPGE